MSRKREYLETVKETKNTSNELNGCEIKYQQIEVRNSTNFKEYTQKQDNLVISPVRAVKTAKAVNTIKCFSPISNSSSTTDETTYKAPNVPTEEQGMSYKPIKGYFEQNNHEINLNE